MIEELQKVNKNLIVVMLSGNGVEMPWEKKVPAIVQGWYLGSEAGNALARVLSGTVNPSGKLPQSCPQFINLPVCAQFAWEQISSNANSLKLEEPRERRHDARVAPVHSINSPVMQIMFILLLTNIQ